MAQYSMSLFLNHLAHRENEPPSPKNCLQPLKKSLHLTMTSIAFETLGASFEFRLMHVEEEVIED